MGSKKSSSTSAQTTSQADNRVVAGDGAMVLGSGASYASQTLYDNDYSAFVTDSSTTDNSTTLTDARQTYTDASYRAQVTDNSTTDNSSAYSYADNSQRWADNSSAYSYADNSAAFTDNSTAASWADYSTTLNDSRSAYSYASDSSNRSTTTINNTGTDAGAVRLAELQAQLLGAAFEDQTDGTKALAAFGFDALSKMGGSATNLYASAGSNTVRAWEHTIDQSGALIDKLLTTAADQNAGARTLAASAISAFQPTDNKTATNWPLIAAAGALAVVGVAFALRKG